MAAEITYNTFGPSRDKPREAFNELVFGSRSLAGGLGVGDMAMVLVQALDEKVEVPVLESLSPL